MKILLIVPQHGYSLVIQAQALSKGLTQIGIENSLIRVDENFKEDIIKNYSPDLVLSVGPWDTYHKIVEIPSSLGFRTIPWTFSHFKITDLLDEFNSKELILTISDFCKEILVRDGVRKELVEVLQEAVDYEFWQPMSLQDLKKFSDLVSISNSKMPLPFKFDLWKLKQENVPIIYTTGGNATGKGALEIISALGKLSKKIGNKWLYLIKTWPYPQSLEYSSQELKLAESLGIFENIRYIVGEFSPYFLKGLTNICDIYVATSRIEGFGLPLVEASLCEKPVVGLAKSATEEVVINEVTGFVCKNRVVEDENIADIDNLADILEKLILDKKLRISLGKRGRKEAILRYSPEVIARKLMEIFSQRLK